MSSSEEPEQDDLDERSFPSVPTAGPTSFAGLPYFLPTTYASVDVTRQYITVLVDRDPRIQLGTYPGCGAPGIWISCKEVLYLEDARVLSADTEAWKIECQDDGGVEQTAEGFQGAFAFSATWKARFVHGRAERDNNPWPFDLRPRPGYLAYLRDRMSFVIGVVPLLASSVLSDEPEEHPVSATVPGDSDVLPEDDSSADEEIRSLDKPDTHNFQSHFYAHTVVRDSAHVVQGSVHQLVQRDNIVNHYHASQSVQDHPTFNNYSKIKVDEEAQPNARQLTQAVISGVAGGVVASGPLWAAQLHTSAESAGHDSLNFGARLIDTSSLSPGSYRVGHQRLNSDMRVTESTLTRNAKQHHLRSVTTHPDHQSPAAELTQTHIAPEDVLSPRHASLIKQQQLIGTPMLHELPAQ